MNILNILKPVRKCTECGSAGKTITISWNYEQYFNGDGLPIGDYLIHRHHVCGQCFEDAMFRRLPISFQRDILNQRSRSQ